MFEEILVKWLLILCCLGILLFFSYRFAKNQKKGFYFQKLDHLPLSHNQSLQAIALGKEDLILVLVSGDKAELLLRCKQTDIEAIKPEMKIQAKQKDSQQPHKET